MEGIGREDQAASWSRVQVPVIPERIQFLVGLAAWQTALLAALLIETHRLKSRLLEQGSPGEWWDAPAHDGTWFVPLLALAPFCWSFRFPEGLIFRRRARLENRFSPLHWKGGLATVLVGAISLAAGEWSLRTPVRPASSFPQVRDVLPVVQDEFSYLLQARGILEQRWWWPGMERAPELFHQQHVLNEGRFGSRYFPGTGFWIAPWLAIGHPEWAPRCAGVLISIGILWIGVEMAGPSAGLIAGLLTALAPGMAIFNQLLLSHQPGLVGLVLFLYFFIHLMRTGRVRDALPAGIGLTFSMLCRPLTAGAIGLPFGIWLAGQAIRSRFDTGLPCRGERRWIAGMLLGLGGPILLGLMLIGWQNQSLTGNLFVTPYQRYTELYTPRHAFGFHQAAGDAVTKTASQQLQRDYNDWAEDLDLPRAVSNSIDRWRGSFAWGLGLIPLLMTMIYGVWTFPWQARPVQLLICSILCLHLAHVPYWLNGMLGHHYVFEADVLCLLLFGICSVQWGSLAVHEGRWLFPGWWSLLVAAAVCLNFVGIGPQGESRVEIGWRPFLQSSAGYRAFETALRQQALATPALILICPAKADLHVQFVRNRPPFTGRILVGIDRPDLYSVDEVAALFPERTLYRYDSTKHRLERITALRAPAGKGVQ